MALLEASHLQAFAAIAEHGSFSAAALALRLTQPALSRRIQALEEAVGVSLFDRGAAGAELTEAGLRLAGHVRVREALEDEILADLRPNPSRGLQGTVRIGGYSSNLRMLVLPAVAPIFRKNPDANLFFIAMQGVRPRSKQTTMLLRGEVDLMIGVRALKHESYEMRRLGRQELVVIESARHRTRENVFLDTRPEDTTTEEYFLAHPSRRSDYVRSYLHDEETILDGVAEGMGRAVVFRTMLKNETRVRPIAGWPSLAWPLYLFQRKEKQRPRLFQAVSDAIAEAHGLPL